MSSGINQILQNILDTIYQNTSNEIGGQELQGRLLEIVNSLGSKSYDNLRPYIAGEGVVFSNFGYYYYLCLADTLPGESPLTTPTKWQIMQNSGKEWEIYFSDVLSEFEMILEVDTTISSVTLGNAVTVQYSTNGGATWTDYSVSVLLTAGLIRWRVSDFGVYTNGAIIIKGY